MIHQVSVDIALQRPVDFLQMDECILSPACLYQILNKLFMLTEIVL
jgi:hypothetical protein